VNRSVGLALILLVILLAVPVTGFGPPTLIESDSSLAPATSTTLRQMKTDHPPAIVAKAAAVMDATTGQVVFEKNAHERRAQASTTKMMTALVTLSDAKLSDIVTAGPNVKTVEPSIIGLDPGDKLTVEQLLYGLLLPSGNDAAVDLAEYVGGSIPQFAEMMNAKAADLGLKDTHFVTPHGLDVDGHYSSAYDLAVIAKTALQNPTFEKIVATRDYRVQGPPAWLFRNNNQLLTAYPGADGVKTGYTDNAGHCLVSSVTRDGHRAISVVLDSDSVWDDSAALMDYFFSNYSWGSVNVADSPLAGYSQGDQLLQATAKTRPQLIFPRWQGPYLRSFVSIPDTAARANGLIGAASYFLFGNRAGQIDLYSEGG
jgi:serine-type D-Ala-D-Ala carboxypeptidase (penicillin-binding protein 5/6)